MLASLSPGGTVAKTKTVPDAAAIEQLKRNVPILIGSWPDAWKSSTKTIRIADSAAGDKRVLEITLSFKRQDIGRVYEATKRMFGMMKSGKSDNEINKLPSDVKGAAANSSAFIKNVGQVWGYAYSEVLNCDPPIARYRIVISDSVGRKVGSVSVSKEDAASIVTGKVTVSDALWVAQMYVFE